MPAILRFQCPIRLQANAVTALAASSKGLVAAGSDDGTVVVYDPAAKAENGGKGTAAVVVYTGHGSNDVDIILAHPSSLILPHAVTAGRDQHMACSMCCADGRTFGVVVSQLGLQAHRLCAGRGVAGRNDAGVGGLGWPASQSHGVGMKS